MWKMTGNHPETPVTEVRTVPEGKGWGVDTDRRLLGSCHTRYEALSAHKWPLHCADGVRCDQAEPAVVTVPSGPHTHMGLSLELMLQ